jgi:hypothetical protein
MEVKLTFADLPEWSDRRGLPYYEIVSEDVLTTAPRPLNPTEPREAVHYLRSRVYCGRLGQCLQIGETSLFATDDDCLIFYGMTHRDYDIWWYLQKETLHKAADFAVLDLAPPQFAVAEECVYFGGSMNFGHFVFENLSRLAVLEQIDELHSLKLAVYHDLPSRFFEFLELAGYGAERVIRIPRVRNIGFENLWAPSCPFYRDVQSVPHVWPAAFHFLRWKICSKLRADRTAGRPRLYLSRQGALQKRVVNEGEVVSYLLKEGFDVFEFSDLSAKEQLALIANAEMIVGPIGAAMAVTVFAPEDCAVIELHPEAPIGGLYNSISQAHWLGQPYQRVQGTRVLLPDNKVESAIFHDFSVDLRKLMMAVEEAKRCRFDERQLSEAL